MHTPEQARALWCPMARVYGVNAAYNREPIASSRQSPTCLADHCAMWRWEHTTASVPTTTQGAGGEPARTFETRTVKTHGYCGLAPLHQ